MGRRYTAQFNAVAVTAQQDFFEVLAPTDAVVVVHRIRLTQTTEVGDAQEEMLSLLIKRGIGSVTSGSGGTTPTAQPSEDGDAAFGGTVEANNTTKMATGTGTIETLQADAWNVRMPWDEIYTPELRPVISPGNRLTVELATTPADSITMNGCIWIEEIGG
jgi:hypothetical protein